MKIIGFNGAPEIDGPVAILLAKTLDVVKLEMEHVDPTDNNCVRTVHLKDVLIKFTDIFDRPPALQELLEDMKTADAFVFATPVHWFGPSLLMWGLMHAMDILEQPDFPLTGKLFCVLTHLTEDGGNQAQMALVGPLSHLGMSFSTYGLMYFHKYLAQMSQGAWQMTAHEKLGKNLVRDIAAMRHRTSNYD